MNPNPKNAHVCILVVDDHPSTATTLARALSQLGPNIEAIAATGGEIALDMVQDKSVDILITDMMMIGMNGLELIEKMQSHPCGRPSYTMLVTAYDVPGLKITARRLKVNEIVIKPIRPERICQIVANAIENMQGEATVLNVPETKDQLKILIADDLPDNVALLMRFLNNEGYVCLSASDGREALAMVRAEMPDLVLLDINMPVLDGFETLQQIRSDPAIGHIPVIMLTAARLDSSDMQSALNMGADDYVTKPFDRRELLARIRTRLRVKEAEDIIRRRNKELNMLPEIGRELSSRLDIDELTDVVLHRAVETLGALVGHIVLLDEEKPLRKTYYFYPSEEQNQNEMHLPELAPLIALVNEYRQGFVIGDAHKDLRWLVPAEDLIRSVVVVPLFGRFGLIGLLILAHERPEYFSVEHMLLLQAIASQSAIAIDNAHLIAGMVSERQVSSPVGASQSAIDEVKLSPKAQKEFLAALAELRAVIAQPVTFNRDQEPFIRRLRSAAATLDAKSKKLFALADAKDEQVASGEAAHFQI